jgi:hypothetical protein
MSYEDDVRVIATDVLNDCLCASISSTTGPSIGDGPHQARKYNCERTSEEGRLAGYVTGNTGANWVKSMTDVERHAELVYAESLFEKASILGFLCPLPPPPPPPPHSTTRVFVTR